VNFCKVKLRIINLSLLVENWTKNQHFLVI